VELEPDATVATLKHRLEQETCVLAKRQKVRRALRDPVRPRRQAPPVHAGAPCALVCLRPAGQILGLKTRDGKPAGDEVPVGELLVKPGTKFMLMGCGHGGVAPCGSGSSARAARGGLRAPSAQACSPPRHCSRPPVCQDPRGRHRSSSRGGRRGARGSGAGGRPRHADVARSRAGAAWRDRLPPRSSPSSPHSLSLALSPRTTSTSAPRTARRAWR
jgi:hypothetical protein